MRALLIFGTASLAAVVLPIPAIAVDGQAFVALPPAPTLQDGFVIRRPDGDFRHRHRHRGRGDDGSVFIYDRDYQGDSLWKADSFNDWWHDRPERAYPHWMLSNQNCDRMWWGGGAWRC